MSYCPISAAKFANSISTYQFFHVSAKCAVYYEFVKLARRFFVTAKSAPNFSTDSDFSANREFFML